MIDNKKGWSENTILSDYVVSNHDEHRWTYPFTRLISIKIALRLLTSEKYEVLIEKKYNNPMGSMKSREFQS